MKVRRFILRALAGIAAVLAFSAGDLALAGPCEAGIANPGAGSADAFGFAVALVNGNLLVGAPKDDTGQIDSGRAYLIHGTTGAVLLTISNPSPGNGDEFGRSVAALGNHLLVGAPYDGTGAGYSGRVYLFDGSTGALLLTINNPTPDYDYFGFSVAAAGNNILIGAPYDSGSAFYAGRAYLYDGTARGTAAGPLFTMNNPTPEIGDNFGHSVAAAGANLLVGAPGDNTGVTRSGSVYLLNGSTGALIRTVNNPTPAYYDEFGRSVAWTGSNIVSGAPYDDGGATDAGSAYVHNGSTGALVMTIPNPFPAANDWFGYSVACSGGNLVAGAYGDDAAGAEAGAAYVFGAATGVRTRTLEAFSPSPSDYFGFSVAASGGDVAAGAYGDSLAPAGGGSAARYASTCSTGSPEEELNGNFGISLAGLADATGDGKGDLVVGAYLEDPGASPEGAGRVHLFNGANMALVHTSSSSTEDNDGNFGRNVQGIADITGDGLNDILVGAWQENPYGAPSNSGAVHVLSGVNGSPVRTILSPNAEDGGKFGARVSGVNDVNGDGWQDIVAGAPYEDPGAAPAEAGRAYIFSGSTGALLRTLASPGQQANGLFGFFAAGLYDLNGDGKGEVAIGAHMEAGSGQPANSGRVHLFSGGTGALIYTLVSPSPQIGGQFGRNLARLFDVSGDGKPDLVVGAPYEEGSGKPSDSGRVHLYNGATGAFIRTIVSPYPVANGQFGLCVQSIPDVNGDGKGEVLVGAPNENPGGLSTAGRAYLFSATGAELKTFVSPNSEAGGLFGVAVHGVQDNNGDGKWEIAAGARGEDPGSSPSGAGRVYMFRSPGY